MKILPALIFATLSAMTAAAPALAATAPLAVPSQRPLPMGFNRVVLLGDSITDGITYPLLLQQALREANFSSRLFLNAGIGGDTAGGMSARLDRDVLSRQPTTVLFSAGVNDAYQKVEPADYEKSVVSILDRLRAQNVSVVVLLPITLRPLASVSPEERAKLAPDALAQLQNLEAELPARMARLDAYRVILRRLSRERGLSVADIPGEMQRSVASDVFVWEADGTHLNFAGYRAWVRAVLDAVGLRDVAVPTLLRIEPAPGIFTDWQLLPRPKDAPRLDAPALTAALGAPDWKPLTLPMPDQHAQASWWLESVRQYGVALDLDHLTGSDHIIARTKFHVDAAQNVFLNTGAGVTAVWLQKPGGAWAPVWQSDGTNTGWHASTRAALQLTPGDNQLLIECGPQFFVSLSPQEL